MNEPAVEPARAPRWKRGARLRILIAGLIGLMTVRVAVGLFPDFMSGAWGAGRSLDRCITEQSILAFLEGKAILSGGPVDGVGNGVETITLRKERISSLKIRSHDPPVILVSFNLNHEGKEHLVEGSFVFTTSDSPEVHYHSWDQFMGHVVSSD